MFYPLPAETVFEAKQRTRRATFYLFILLVCLYVFFVDLLALVAAFWVANWFWIEVRSKSEAAFFNPLPVLEITTVVAVLLAVFHFIVARRKTLDELMGPLGARAADPLDEYHKQFIDIVQEVEAATGIRGIRAVTLPDPGTNAFSLQDGQGQCVIGATEGLLTKLTRPELSAVVAHEAAHLVHEDSRLVTTAYFLFSFFGSTSETLAKTVSVPGGSYGRRRASSSGGVWGASVTLMIIAGIGYLVTKLVFMAISREREYYADSDGVALCKDPLAMAESLYKMSTRYRGDLPPGLGALFILNPTYSSLDEGEGLLAGLFSNHPPISQRISKLLQWAKADLQTVRDAVIAEDKKAVGGATKGPLSAEGGSFMAFHDNQWQGPYSPLQLLSLGNMTPGTWVCPAGGQEVIRASDAPELLPLFIKQVQGTVTKANCPRCKVPLITTLYEGVQVEHCEFCQGNLLRGGVLERLIFRGQGQFAEADVQRAQAWRATQQGPLKDRDLFPAIFCPHCGGPMGKMVHSYMTQVVLDRCSNAPCHSIWCDGRELETIQMLQKDAQESMTTSPTPSGEPS